MLGLTEAREAIRRDIGRIVERMGGLDASAWDGPTRLEGWSVRDLGRHLVHGQQLQAEGWRGLQAGADQAPDVPTLTMDEPEELVAAIRDRHERFLAELDAATDEDLARPCPMPYGTLPGAVVLQLAVLEAGVHRSDLEDALGLDGVHLEPDTLDAVFTLLPGSLPQLAMAATERPAVGTGVRLAPASGPGVSLRVGAGGWETVADGADWTYVVTGAPAAVALFALGRVPADHPALTIEGDAELAARFKVHFPGP